MRADLITGTDSPKEVTIAPINGNPNHLEVRWTQRTEDGETHHMRHIVLSHSQEIKTRAVVAEDDELETIV